MDKLLHIACMVYASLLLTVAAETVLSMIIGVRNFKELRLIAIINCITNPVINIIMSLINLIFHLQITVFYLAACPLEIAVVIWEWALYKRYLSPGRMHPMAFSAILNTASFATGILFWSVLI